MAQALLDMLNRAERALEVDPGQAKVFIGQASRLLEPALDGGEARKAGLARWQERKVSRHIAECLDQPIRNQDLAEVVGLSISHFGRRFKASFGVSPRDYLIRARVERAKTLMHGRDAPLSQIALDSGFCDQAHMCRLFRVVVGSTPSRWRREQAPAFRPRGSMGPAAIAPPYGAMALLGLLHIPDIPRWCSGRARHRPNRTPDGDYPRERHRLCRG